MTEFGERIAGGVEVGIGEAEGLEALRNQAARACSPNVGAGMRSNSICHWRS